jgi:hypothetical protein
VTTLKETSLHEAKCMHASVVRTMSGIHTFVVRTAVKAGMYTLPSRHTFLAGIGEPGAGETEG